MLNFCCVVTFMFFSRGSCWGWGFSLSAESELTYLVLYGKKLFLV